MTIKRVNVTLEDDLHGEATKYADDRGMSFSAFVSRALKDAMNRGDDTSPSSSGQAGVSPADIREMIQAEVEAAIRSIHPGSDGVLPLVTPDDGPAKVTPRKERPAKDSGSMVSIPTDIQERASHYKASQIENASGKQLKRGTMQGIITGISTRTSPDKLALLIETLDRLDEDTSSKDVIQNVLITPE